VTRRSAVPADPAPSKASPSGARTRQRSRTATSQDRGTESPDVNEPTSQPRSPKRRRAAAPRRTRVIAVANQKGGVGKSTTAVSLGAALAELGYRVLVVDLDPQGNASTGLGIRHERREITVYDVLAAEAPIEGAVVPTPVERLFAIPSTIDLAGAEIELVSQFSRELRLRRALEPLKDGSYDFVFLDCPPSLGLLTVNALAAADELIVPIQCEYYALEGLGQLLRNVRLVQQNVNPGLHLTGIVMTMYDPRTKLSEQVVEEVRRFFGDRVYETVIPRTVRLSEAPGFGQPITVYDPRSRGAECYRELAREVAARLPSDEPIPAFDRLPATPAPPPEPEPMQAPRPLRPEPDAAATEELEPEASEEGEPETEAEVGVREAAVGAGPATLAAEEVQVEEEREVILEAEVGSARPEVEPSVSSESQPELEEEPDLQSERGPAAAARRRSREQGPREQAEVEATEARAPQSTGAGPTREATRVLEPGDRSPDADGTEAWIAELETEARAEAEGEPAPEPPPPLAEIDLEPEGKEEVAAEPGSVVRIVDRDAAGEHETEGAAPAERPARRRWSLFRRGGGR